MATEQSVHKLKIDDDFRRFIPPLSAAERKQLEENIIQDGCRDPLVVWNKTIIDGHNRYEICTEHQIPFSISYIFLLSREEAIAWICANQLGRRNITEETRRYLIGKRYELEKIIGAHNAAGTNQFVRKEVGYQTDNEPRFDTNALRTGERLGKEYRVGSATVVRYGAYTIAVDKLSEAAPELHSRIMSGQLKIPQEKVIEISRLSPTEMRRVSAEIAQNPKAMVRYADRGKGMPKNTSNKIQLAHMQIGAIKDMPAFDPDAEILSLALTVPSWVSSINRVSASAKFSEISDNAHKKLISELNNLKSAAETMILSAGERD